MTGANGRSGHDSGLCGARTRSGGRCRRPAGWGTGHPGIGACKLHLGATPNHAEHARQELAVRAEAAALAELGTLGVPPMCNPLEQLAQLAGEARAWLDMLRGLVAELGSLTAPDHLGDERARVVVVLLERAMDRCGQFCEALARLRIDDRLAQITAEQVRVLTVVLDQVLRELGVSDHPRTDPRVAPVVAAAIRASAPGRGGAA